MDLTSVEESLICLVSAVVTVQKIDPKNSTFVILFNLSLSPSGVRWSGQVIRQHLLLR